ncbi:MAG: hypothetical protein KDE56_18020 [Anaerolineales bacterium]|nr:hypothetical protein [Anaerolineales bacterium]
MALATIEIQLEEDVARMYQAASIEQKDKMRLLINLWLREFTPNAISLKQIMDETSDKAVERGLTPELLETLLSDD